MTRIITVPGIGNSGPQHWQSLWERQNPAMERFEPSSWDAPELSDWVAALERKVSGCQEPPLLVVHSLGCLMIPHWAAQTRLVVRGAFMVCVPDPAASAFPRAEAASFTAVPEDRLPFPALIVASGNDPFGTPENTSAKARAWGAGLVWAGELGHINASSGIGDWAQGKALFEAFRAGTSLQA